MRRTRSDSTSSIVKALVASSQLPLDIPKHVEITDLAKPFWYGIINSRAREEWTEVDLVIGAQLAQCQADLNAESQTLRQEGSVIENARGTQIMNPRHSVVEALARREMAMMRSLRMGGRSVPEDPRTKAGVRKIEREARQLRKELEGDSLLAS